MTIVTITNFKIMAGIRWSLIFLLVFIILTRSVFLMTRETSIFYLKSVVKNIQYCTLIFGSLRNGWVKKSYKKLQFLFCFTISKELCIKAELTVVPNKPNIYSVAIKVLPLKEDSVYWMQITPMECAQTDVVVPLPCLMRACISVSPQHPGNSASMPLGFSFISAFCGHWTHGALQAWGLFLPLVSQVPFLMIWK